MLIRSFLRYFAMWLLLPWVAIAAPALAGAAANVDNMFIAIKNGDAEAVVDLLRQGVDPDVLDEQGYTALMMASREGSAEVVRQLLAHGAKVYKRNLYKGRWG